MSVVADVLEYVARSLVEEPDEVRVTEEDGQGGLRLRLEVAPADVGKIIGRGGRTARAIRTVVRAAGTTAGLHPNIEIVG
jgi:predicted RNA-binding protein YlqC (UPF0109 family)